jgi:hypothetical protein
MFKLNSDNNIEVFGFPDEINTNNLSQDTYQDWKKMLKKHEINCNLWNCDWCKGKRQKGKIKFIKSYT